MKCSLDILLSIQMTQLQLAERLCTGEITSNSQKMQGCHLRQRILFLGYCVMLIIGWVLEEHAK
uniref:Serine/threonine-protein kinase n=1 Tax=Rhizophora mucronata TaxID=61149 RepID=A0A2P2L0K9_RHIMU